jgi:hypothetical protein
MSVYPNPEFYGLTSVGQYFIITDTRTLPQTRTQLACNHRLFLTYEYGPQVGHDLMLSTLHEFKSPAERTAHQNALKEMHGIEPASPLFTVKFPPPKMELSPLDFRMIRALRIRPEMKVPELARRLGIPVKRARRHFNALLDGDAMFFLPQTDFAAGGGSVLLVSVFFPADSDYWAMRECIVRLCPDLIRVFPSVKNELILPPMPDGTRLTYFAFFLPVNSVQLAAPIEVGLRALKDVRNVSVTFPLRSYENRSCFDDLLEPDAEVGA